MTFWQPHSTAGLLGDNRFRLMPTDDLVTRPASGLAEVAAGGHALLFRYRWEHADDGLQDGVLLVGAPDPTGDDPDAVQAMWLDSWHQRPGPLDLTGTATPTSCALHGTYGGDWGWEIDLDLSGGLRMTMRNVIPAGALPDQAELEGPYDVMVMTLA